MQRSRKFANPFYGLLLIVGIGFALTATAYGVMAFRNREQPAAGTAVAAEKHPLMLWMSQHGDTALLAELAALAVCTFGAIATDDYWQRRSKNV